MGSEIPRPTTVWMVLKPVVNNGIFISNLNWWFDPGFLVGTINSMKGFFFAAWYINLSKTPWSIWALVRLKSCNLDEVNVATGHGCVFYSLVRLMGNPMGRMVYLDTFLPTKIIQIVDKYIYIYIYIFSKHASYGVWFVFCRFTFYQSHWRYWKSFDHPTKPYVTEPQTYGF